MKRNFNELLEVNKQLKRTGMVNSVMVIDDDENRSPEGETSDQGSVQRVRRGRGKRKEKSTLFRKLDNEECRTE